MKFMKSRRTVLIVTVLLVAMLSVVGGTFAWFTDSVESTSNTIQSGTLDLELYQKTEEGEWQNVADLTEPMFSYDLWEPGYTMWKALKVENKGTLALKWKAMFEMEGEMSKLAEVIDVYAREGSDKPERSEIPANAQDTSPTNPNSQWWYDGTLKDFIENAETNTYGSLAAGEAKELTLVLKMREEAGNEYQNLTLGAFNLKIVATQDTVEKDSFDDQYDADAEYPGPVTITVTTADELVAALEAAVPGTIIDATGVEYHITSADGFEIPAGITMKNATIFADYRGINYVFFVGEGDGVVFENCRFGTTSRVIVLGGTVNGPDSVQYNNCTFEGQVLTNWVDNADGVAEFNNCTFKKAEGSTYNYTEGMGGTHVFNKCTFDYTGVAQTNMGVITSGQINAYSESEYSTTVILDGCTRINCGTRQYGPNSTLTIK